MVQVWRQGVIKSELLASHNVCKRWVYNICILNVFWPGSCYQFNRRLMNRILDL